MTRGLAYHLFADPVLSDEQAIEAIQRILILLESLPGEPAFLHQFAPRLTRLALAVARENHWQPPSLGGNGPLVQEILALTPNSLAASAVLVAGVDTRNSIRTFFETDL